MRSPKSLAGLKSLAVIASIEAAVDRAFAKHFDRILMALQIMPSDIADLKRRVSKLEKIAVKMRASL
jgi:hypothetical protein